MADRGGSRYALSMSGSTPLNSGSRGQSDLNHPSEPVNVGPEPSVANLGQPTHETQFQFEPRIVQTQVERRANAEVGAAKLMSTAAKHGIAQPALPGRRSAQRTHPTAAELRENLTIVENAAMRQGPLAHSFANPPRVAREALAPIPLSDVRGRIVAFSNILAEIDADSRPSRDNSTISRVARRSLSSVTAARVFDLSVEASHKAASSHTTSAADLPFIQQSAETISQRLDQESAMTSDTHLKTQEETLIKEVICLLEIDSDITSLSRAKRIGMQLSVLVESGLPSHTLNLIASSPAIRTLIAASKNDRAINYSSWNAETPASHVLEDGTTFEAKALKLACSGADGRLSEQKVLGSWVINEYKFDQSKNAGRILIGLQGTKALVLAAWPKHPNVDNPTSYYKSFCKDRLKAIGEL